MRPGDSFATLDKTLHDRPSFDCGEAELNDFLRTRAANHMEVGVSVTRVLPSVDPLPNGKHAICSFYTIAPSTIKRETLPGEIARKLPHYPIPVFLLAQLAVHSQCQGQGLGKITLIKALSDLNETNKRMRGFAVIVDCINDGTMAFYGKYGFQHLYHHNGRARLFMPVTTVGRLFE